MSVFFVRLKARLGPPVFPNDEEKNRQARLLHILLAGTILLSLCGALIIVPLFYVEKAANWAILAAILGIACAAFALMRSGRVRAASVLILFGTWPVFAALVYLAGGMQSIAVSFFIVITMIAGLLLGVRGGLAYAGLCCMAGLGMILLEAGGVVPPRVFPVRTVTGWMDMTTALLMAVTAIHVFNRDLYAAFALTRQRLAERQQAEEALQAHEQKFRRLFESSRDCVFITDAGGRVREANPAAEALWGYSLRESADFDIARLFMNRRELMRLANTVRKRGYVDNAELRGRRRDGSVIDVLVSATLITGPDGRISGYQGSARDITERKRAETDIARQVRRLNALHTIERAISGSTDLQTILDLLAREVVEHLHMDAASILLPDENGEFLHFAAGAGFRTDALQYTRLKFGDGLAGRAALTRSVIRIPDLAELTDNPILAGSISREGFTAYFGVPLIAEGELCGVMEIFQRSTFDADPDWPAFLETLAGQAAIAIDNARLLDMTKTTLKETEALYRINQGLVATIDPLRLMQEAVTLLQVSFQYYYVQIYVRDPTTDDFVVRAGSGEIGKALIAKGHRLAAEEGIVGHTAKTGAPFLTNNVDEVSFFIRNALLPDTKSELAVPIQFDGQVLGLLDIQQVPPFTLTRRDLQLVDAVANQLAVALQKTQLYADLQNSLRQEKEMRAQLVHSEKLAVTGRLMASVSHELNNPLQAIQNALFLLKNERRISAQAKQDLDIVLSETERMAAMLDRLRTTYKAVRAEDFGCVQVNGVIQDVHALVATHLRHAGIAFKFDPDPALPTVNGVSDQLRQVIINLFMNAVDAMPGGGRLAVATSRRPEEREILISVADTGKGIDPDIQPHLFETFISGKENGTGLGLAISQEIVLKHKGRIRAENQPDGGAVFRVWLPVPQEGGA
jgi:two-component system, sporulation sensor kinase E